MDTLKFKALKVAVTEGSLTNAAASLGYTQAGLTHMMNRLEREIDCTLLKRDKFGVHLTDEGKRLMPYIEDMLSSSDKLEKEIALMKEQRGHTIRIAAYTSIISYWLPTIMSEFKKTHPNVSFEIIDDSVKGIYSLVCDGKADLGFVSRQDGARCNFTHLKNDRLIGVFPPDSETLKGLDSVSIEVFNDLPFIMPSLGFDMDIMRVLEKSGVYPKINKTNVNDAGVVSMVAHGLGVSILSELILRESVKNVITLPLMPDAYRDLGIISMPGLTKLSREFMEFAEKKIDSV